MAANAEDWLTK